MPNRDPKLPNAMLNSPENFLSEIAEIKRRLTQLETAQSPSYEEIVGGRVTIADLILYPATGVQVTDPTSTEYTGGFAAGEGIEFDGVLYVSGYVLNGVLIAGFTDGGTLYADAALIAGWDITATTIEKLAAGVGIIMDSANQVIKVGNTAGVHIQIDGANQRIRSSNFAAGSTGMNIDAATGDAEFNNIVARGELKTFLLTAENQMAVSGQIIVSKDAGKLAAAVAAADTTVDFGKALTVGDWIKIQGSDAGGSSSVEWMLIGALDSGTTYNVTRDVDGSGANDWSKDTPFAVVGQAGDNRIELVAGAVATIRLVTQGSVWSSYTVQVEMSTVAGGLKSGGGAVVQNEKGITLAGSANAFLIYDADQKAYSYIYQSGGTLILQTFKATGSQLLVNGDFGTGDSTGWTETDPFSKMSVVANELKIDSSNNHANTYWSQAISAPNGCFVILRYKNNGTDYCNICVGDGDALMWVQSLRSSEFATTVVWFENSVEEIVISADTGPGDTVYIDNIEVWERANSGDQAIVQIDDQFVDLWGKVRVNGEFAASTVPTPNAIQPAVAEFHTATPESPFVSAVISTGTIVRLDDVANHPGIARISNNSAANAGARVMLTLDSVLLQGGEVFECIFRIPTAAAACIVAMGFMDSGTTAAVVDGVWAEFVNNVATLRTSSNSVASSQTLGAVAINTWYRLKIKIAEDLSAVTFYIYNEDGSILYALGDTRNIPQGTGRETGVVAKAYRTNTTNTSLLEIDYIAYYSTKTLVR